MNEEEFSFDLSKKDIENFKKAIGYDEVEAIHKRFENGTETEEDLINNIIHYKLKFNVEDEKEIEVDVVELKYYNKIIDLYNKQKECNEELRKICYGKALEDLDTSRIYEQEQNADLTTVYMNGFYDGEKKWQDKIKQKIEENEKMTKMKEFNYAVYRYCKNILEDLLKE